MRYNKGKEEKRKGIRKEKQPDIREGRRKDGDNERRILETRDEEEEEERNGRTKGRREEE